MTLWGVGVFWRYSSAMKNTEILENELYWYCLQDGTWTAMCRVGDRAYWIGDLKGEPMSRLTGEWRGPIAPPPQGEVTLTEAAVRVN